MLNQHPDSARPTVRPSRKVGRLLIQYFAGVNVGNLNDYVVVSLGNSLHDSKQRLVGTVTQSDAGLASLAVPQRFGPNGLGVGIIQVNQNVSARLRKHPARLAAHLLHCGFGVRRLSQESRRRRGVFEFEIEHG